MVLAFVPGRRELAVGFTDILVYTNDCADPTNEILDRLATHGFVTRVDNPVRPETGEKPQHAALKDAGRQAVRKAADWVLTIDVDEFLNIHVGDVFSGRRKIVLSPK